jgi:hypothetical protein
MPARAEKLARIRDVLARMRWVSDSARVCPGIRWEDVGVDTRERYLAEQKIPASLVLDVVEEDVPPAPLVLHPDGVEALAVKLAWDECWEADASVVEIERRWGQQSEGWKNGFRDTARKHIRIYLEGSGERVE